MCTLTYLPTQTGFLFTSNRDEIISREAAVFPVYQQAQNHQLLMPLDPQGGGTWILAAEDGEAACLLNGAFENHARKPPYRKSRGRVIVESFDFTDPQQFVENYDFENIEPFTLVKVLPSSGGRQIHEIRWDGSQLHHAEINPANPHIWSSVTLYDAQMRRKRQQWFDTWLAEKPAYNMENIRHFHLHGGEGDPTVDFKMTRSGGLQTISLTCLEVKQDNIQVDYLKLTTDQHASASLSHNALRKA